MLAKRHHLFTVAAATMALNFAATAADAAGLFTLNSTTFADGKIMPKKVANSRANAPNNPNCVGDNVSPQFSWSNVPDGTHRGGRNLSLIGEQSIFLNWQLTINGSKNLAIGCFIPYKEAGSNFG